MENNFDYSKEVAQHLVDGLQIDYLKSVNGGFQFHNERVYTLPELITYFHPYISNATFQREKEIVQRENLRTIMVLARTVSVDSLFNDLIEALNYRVVHHPNQI